MALESPSVEAEHLPAMSCRLRDEAGIFFPQCFFQMAPSPYKPLQAPALCPPPSPAHLITAPCPHHPSFSSWQHLYQLSLSVALNSFCSHGSHSLHLGLLSLQVLNWQISLSGLAFQASASLFHPDTVVPKPHFDLGHGLCSLPIYPSSSCCPWPWTPWLITLTILSPFIHSFVHPFNKQYLRLSHAAGSVLGTGLK